MTGIKPRTARVTIYQGDDLATLSEFDAAVARAENRLAAAEQRRASVDRAAQAEGRRSSMTLDEAVVVTDALQDALDAVASAGVHHHETILKRDAFADETEDRGVLVVLNALPRKTWRALIADHPPRDGHDGDKVVGVNEDTLREALVPKSIDHVASTIDGDVAVFLDALSDFDFDRLYVTAFALNRGSAMADPTLRLASGTSQT